MDTKQEFTAKIVHRGSQMWLCLNGRTKNYKNIVYREEDKLYECRIRHPKNDIIYKKKKNQNYEKKI